MIAYYAMGGGLGHLTRARAVQHTLQFNDPVLLLTASPFATPPWIPSHWQIASVPPGPAENPTDYCEWLQNVLRQQKPTALFIDTFPMGMVGEFAQIELAEEIPWYHVARHLNWNRYTSMLSNSTSTLSFTKTYYLEPLESDHQVYLQRVSKQWIPLELTDPVYSLPTSLQEQLMQHQQDRCNLLWLIVHSGEQEEVETLIDYTQGMIRLEAVNPRVWLCTPKPCWDLPEAFEWIEVYPATSLFPWVDRVISGGGFNVMRQMEPFREKHRVLPFERYYDDQFWRVSVTQRGTGQTL